MAIVTNYRVYAADGTYMAACREIEAAAALAALYGEGSTIRSGHRTLWTEGRDGSAADSYDDVSLVAAKRASPQRRGTGA